MNGISRSARISKAKYITNEYGRDVVGMERTIIDDVEQNQLESYGHMKRLGNNRLSKLHWRLQGKRNIGRPLEN